jgi:hypothetical protein
VVPKGEEDFEMMRWEHRLCVTRSACIHIKHCQTERVVF